MKAILFANTDWYLYNFRLPLAEALRRQGYEVVLLSPPGSYGERLQQAGFRWQAFPFSRRGVNPLAEGRTIWRLARLYRREKAEVVHHFTIKCVLYGSLAARLAGIKNVLNAVTGMGYVFVDNRLEARLIRLVVKAFYPAILRGTQVIFQNGDDQGLFQRYGWVRPGQSRLIPGSGVDTQRFRPLPEPDEPAVVLLPGRFLWDKGLGEFVEAARILRAAGVKARFALAGRSDPANPAAVPEVTLQEWQAEGVVECWGWQEDMAAVYARAHIVCLPSYREGLPRGLIEAAACGRPLVAADAPGCREVVRHGENGLLVAPRSASSLADGLRALIEAPDLRRQMGARGRQIVEAEFSVERIVAETLRAYQQTLSGSEA